MNLAEAKTVKVTGENHKRLKKVGQMHETIDDVIHRLLDFCKEKKRR
jgi:predicted CopG family antitoxin